MVSKHLRISVEHKHASNVIDSFINKFKPIKWFVAYENKNTLNIKYDDYEINNHHKCVQECHIDEPYEINPHIQALITYNIEPTKQAVSTFFKTQPILKNTNKELKNIAGYYHKEIVKSEENNIIYMMKDLHIICHNGYTEKEIEELMKKTIKINESKSLSSKEKLYNIYLEKYGIKYPKSKYHLYRFIDEIYIYEWKKSPLALGHKLSYSTHILFEIHRNIKDKNEELFEILSMNLYGIRDHDELIHNIDIEEARKYNLKCLADTNCDFIDEDEEIEIKSNMQFF